MYIERWEKSNRMCLMNIKKAISKAFRGTIFETINKDKEFLEEIKKRKKDKEVAEVPYQKNQHKEKKRLMVVSSVELRDIRRSNVPTIMLGVPPLTSVCPCRVA